MPTDLFGDINHRPHSARFNRRTVVLVTAAGHTLVFTGALFFSLSSPGLLPTPRIALAYLDTTRNVQLVDIQLPSTPRPPAQTPADTANHAPEPAAAETPAPLVAADSIRPDTEPGRLSVTRSSDLLSVESSAGAGSLISVGRASDVSPRTVTPTAPPAPVRLHSGILHPVKRVDVSPAYPSLAQSAHVQGVVILEAIVDATGAVTSVQVLRSIPLLDQAAIDAVRQWRYTPAMLNGSPVPVIMTVTVNFKL